MTESLKALQPAARAQFTDEFLTGEATPSFEEYVIDPGLDHPVALNVVDVLIETVMTPDKFEKPELSDGWLAPRLHAALRLRRAEAASSAIWAWLATVRYPGYVRWRWPGRDAIPKPTQKRFLGSDRDNALARLWWMAELTRNGTDYTRTVRAFTLQDIPNTWLVLDAFHNKPAALAAVDLISSLSSDQSNRLATVMNHYLTTIMLDTIAPSDIPDHAAVDEWVQGSPDPDELLSDDLPTGPDEDPADSDQIGAVATFIQRAAAEVGMKLPIGAPIRI